MEIPFVLKFLKNIDLFQDLNNLDKIFEYQFDQLNLGKTSTIPLWQAEKKILYWTYKYHKHLGSPLRIFNFKRDIDTKGEESYFEFNKEEITKISIRNVFGNLVNRGYANFYPDGKIQDDCEGIIFTREGLDMGGLIQRVHSLLDISRYEKLSNYNEKTNATKYLRRNIWAKIYWGYLIAAWVAFIMIIFLIFKEFWHLLIKPIISLAKDIFKFF